MDAQAMGSVKLDAVIVIQDLDPKTVVRVSSISSISNSFPISAIRLFKGGTIPTKALPLSSPYDPKKTFEPLAPSKFIATLVFFKINNATFPMLPHSTYLII